MGVKATHKDYDRLMPLWQRCRDAVAGQCAIHMAGEKYLPKLTNEDDPSYKARKCRSDFFNATWRTISGLTGMAFRKPPTTTLPAVIESYKSDINLKGVNLDALAEEVTDEILEVGRVGLLVDHPVIAENVAAISQATAEQLGQRPTIQLFTAEHIRNWKFDRVNNAWVLVMVVLGECEQTPKDGDEFETVEEDRYRVLDLFNGAYRQRLFKVNKDGKDEQIDGDIFPLMNGKPLDYIPFLIIGRGGKGDQIDEPPLIDLVDANIAHYQVNADYRHGLHFTGLPTLFLAGMVEEEGKPWYIGSAAAITSPNPDAKGMFIEYTGQGLGAVEKALASLERRMAILGARMIADETKQAETLGATQIKRQGENSILARIVIGVSEAFEEALGIMAEWAGNGTSKIVYQINREFAPVAMTAQDLTALMATWQGGGLSEPEFFDLLKRGDLVDAEKTLDEHQAEIDENPPVVKPAPVVNQGGMAA